MLMGIVFTGISFGLSSIFLADIVEFLRAINTYKYSWGVEVCFGLVVSLLIGIEISLSAWAAQWCFNKSGLD